MTQREKEIEARIRGRLKDGPAGLEIKNSTSDAKNLAVLLGQHKSTVLPDTSAWNLHPNFMQDVIGGMIPDIVLRSTLSGQNRISIEVKEGDRVLITKYGGTEVKLNGKEFKILRSDDLLAIVE